MTRLTIFNAFLKEQVRAFLARFPPWSNTSFWWYSVIELRKQVERVIEDVFLLLKCHGNRVLYANVSVAESVESRSGTLRENSHAILFTDGCQ